MSKPLAVIVGVGDGLSASLARVLSGAGYDLVLAARDAGKIAALARETGAWCKLSGLVTEAGPDWQTDDLRPYVDHLLDSFGPDRLIWGSDWPVCTLASSYERWLEASETLLCELSEAQRVAIFGRNAAQAYRLRE